MLQLPACALNLTRFGGHRKTDESPEESTDGEQYSEEFKKDAVRLLLARGTRTAADIAASIGVTTSMLHRWHARYSAKVNGQAVDAQREREDIKTLRRQVRQLKQDSELLKKAAALHSQRR